MPHEHEHEHQHITVHHEFHGLDALLVEVVKVAQAVSHKLGLIEQKLDKIMASQAEMEAALTKIDAATTQTAENVVAIGTVADTISTEVDALQDALKNAGVSQALLDQAAAVGSKADSLSAAAGALVPVLQGIASKGSVNPVPVPVPPPIS